MLTMKNHFQKKIKAKNKHREFIKIMNGLLQLSDREAEVLSLLMKIDDEWSPVLSEEKNVLSTDARRAIMKETRINKNNLTKYLNTLKEKGLVFQNEMGGYEVTPLFMPREAGDIIEVIFTLDFGL